MRLSPLMVVSAGLVENMMLITDPCGWFSVSLAAQKQPDFVQVAGHFAPQDEVGVVFSLNLWNVRIGDRGHSTQCHHCSLSFSGSFHRRKAPQ